MTTSTVCLIAKDEDRSIAEWIAYQKVIGFDRVVVYDNDSTDKTPEIVKTISLADPTVEYVHWPSRTGERPQLTAYADATRRAKTDWIAYFDTDEFLLLNVHKNVNDYLFAFGSTVSSVAVNWRLFGNSGRKEAGTGLTIERFTRCGTTKYAKHYFCKSIVRPQFVERIDVHAPLMSSGTYANSSGWVIEHPKGAKTEKIDFDWAQLNHYIVKSEEEFAIKRRRGNATRAPEENDKYYLDENSQQYWDSHNVNHEEHKAILRYCDKVKALIADWLGRQP